MFVPNSSPSFSLEVTLVWALPTAPLKLLLKRSTPLQVAEPTGHFCPLLLLGLAATLVTAMPCPQVLWSLGFQDPTLPCFPRRCGCFFPVSLLGPLQFLASECQSGPGLRPRIASLSPFIS